jgi:transposase
LLTINGIREPNVTDLFGQHGIHFIERLELLNESQQVLRSLLRELAYLKEEIELLESRLAKIGKQGRFKKGVKRIMEIRGVGYYSALTQLAWNGPVDRFPDDRKISA